MKQGISSYTINPYVKFFGATENEIRQFKFESTDVVVTTKIEARGSTFDIAPKPVVGASKTSARINLFNAFNGLSIGSTTVSASEIASAIPEELVPSGQFEKIIVTHNIQGNIKMLTTTGLQANTVANAIITWELIYTNPTTIVAPPKCPDGQIFDIDQGRCVDLILPPPPEGCPEGFTLTLGLCFPDEIPPPVECPVGYTLNFGTCKLDVVPPPVECPQGSTLTGGICILVEVECPDESTLSVVGDECQIVEPECKSGCSETPIDTNTLYLIGGALAVVGILVYAMKRRN